MGKTTRKPAEKQSQAAPSRGKRLWLVRAGLATLVPLLVLVGLEGGMRLCGWGYPTAFCLRASANSARPTVYTENRKFLWQFYSPNTNLRPNPFAVVADKPPGTRRIVVLGESAAAGTPNPAYNFGRILERMLDSPTSRVEVINAAMNGVNSHILLPVARDCLRLKPDLFLIYMGNNEMVGLYAPGPHSGRLTGHLNLLHAYQWLRATRVGQCLAPLFQRLEPESASTQEQDAAFFAEHRVARDDPRRAAVYNNFRVNLAGICAAAQQVGAKVVLMTVAVNLKDSPPFGSLHRDGLSPADLEHWETEYAAGSRVEAVQPAQALEHFAAAAKLDDHYAELHYRLARCYQALEQGSKAGAEFSLARDWDALPFRADSKLNQLIREQAADTNAAIKNQKSKIKNLPLLVDTERLMAEASGGVPRDNFFSDHAHPNFSGDYLLAKAVLPEVRRAFGDLGNDQSLLTSAPTVEECAARLAYTRVDESKSAVQMAQTRGLPPFTSQLEHAQRQRELEQRIAERYGNLGQKDLATAIATYQHALRQRPDDVRLYFNFGQLLLLGKDFAGAAEQFKAAKERWPHWAPLRAGLSAALVSAGKKDEAVQELREALKIEPESKDIKAGLEQLGNF
jgi:tetratricopeptide (TPR) repeat protein